MTLYLIDIASWQSTEKRPNDPLNLTKAKAAGVDLVNIKTGQGDWYTYRTWMGFYAQEARRLGLGVSTFHWLDNTASGAAQAKIAYDRMKRLGDGSTDGMAHQCDCEDSSKPATERIWRDYVKAMQDYLGRPIVNYTGDWWWTAASRRWQGGSLTPYLWAAPNKGYLGSYPGDTSTHWRAGYGGWDDYAVLQYAVSPIPGAGGGNLSKSAIRDPKVWAALTGTKEDDMSWDEIIELPAVDDVKYTDSTRPARAVLGAIFAYTLQARNQEMAELRNVKAALTDIQARMAQPTQVTVTDEQVAAALANPAFLDAVAKAVADENARRQQD